MRRYLLAFLTEDESLFVNGSTSSESASPHTEVSDATGFYGVSNALFGTAQPGGRADAWVPPGAENNLERCLRGIAKHRRSLSGAVREKRLAIRFGIASQIFLPWRMSSCQYLVLERCFRNSDVVQMNARASNQAQQTPEPVGS